MYFRFIITIYRSEQCRARFSIFWKKSSIFFFERQKANSLTFCAKISSDRRIWPNRHWNRVEWTLEMVFNTYHHTRTCLDEKIEIDEKKTSKKNFLTNFLEGYFKESRYFPGYNFPTTGILWWIKSLFKGIFSLLQDSVVQVTKFHSFS